MMRKRKCEHLVKIRRMSSRHDGNIVCPEDIQMSAAAPTPQSLASSLSHTHTPTHANNQLSHHDVNQISLHSRCCITAPSIIQRCFRAHQGAATTNGNCLLISRAPLHLCISVSRLSGRAPRAPWCVPLRFVEKPFEPELGFYFSEIHSVTRRCKRPQRLSIPSVLRAVRGMCREHVRPYWRTCGHFRHEPLLFVQ